MNQRDLQTALRSFFEARPDLGVSSAYLFGSHAQGRAHRESDVDVAVLLAWDRYPTSQERFDVRVSLGSELIHALRHNEVDLVILNDAPPMLGREIVWTGERVYLGDPEADHDYVRDVQLRAADLAPFLEKMRKLKLEALAR
jgi:predicted nucleotidyltransferase